MRQWSCHDPRNRSTARETAVRRQPPKNGWSAHARQTDGGPYWAARRGANHSRPSGARRSGAVTDGAPAGGSRHHGGATGRRTRRDRRGRSGPGGRGHLPAHHARRRAGLRNRPSGRSKARQAGQRRRSADRHRRGIGPGRGKAGSVRSGCLPPDGQRPPRAQGPQARMRVGAATAPARTVARLADGAAHASA